MGAGASGATSAIGADADRRSAAPGRERRPDGWLGGVARWARIWYAPAPTPMLRMQTIAAAAAHRVRGAGAGAAPGLRRPRRPRAPGRARGRARSRAEAECRARDRAAREHRAEAAVAAAHRALSLLQQSPYRGLELATRFAQPRIDGEERYLQDRRHLADRDVVDVVHDQDGAPRQRNPIQRRQHQRARLLALQRVVGPGARVADLDDTERDFAAALAFVCRRDPKRDSEQKRPQRAVWYRSRPSTGAGPGRPPAPDRPPPTATCRGVAAFDRRSPARSGTRAGMPRRRSTVEPARQRGADDSRPPDSRLSRGVRSCHEDR